MDHFDIIQWLGSRSCNGAFDFWRHYKTCTHVEAWNWGAILLSLGTLAIFVVLVELRRRERRDGYLWDGLSFWR